MLFKKIITGISAATLTVSPLQVHAHSNCSTASHYGVGDGYHGRLTANGERFNAYGNTVAHRYLPFGTRLKVTNTRNNRSVIVRVNDRGPFVGGRTLDLSYGAFKKIQPPSRGLANVCYKVV